MNNMNTTIPTLDRLQAKIPLNLNVNEVTTAWFNSFSEYVEIDNIDGILSIFVQDSYWRDILALTWDFRTFAGATRIKRFLMDRLLSANMTTLKLREDFIGLQHPYPDVAWIQAMFTFETNIGFGSGIFRLVPTASGEWKGHCMFTNLEDLRGFPERIGDLRNNNSAHGNWTEQRLRELEFEGGDPVVLICGGGQSGLELAARLKTLDVPTLVVEKNERIGDNWRNRYESLCLHDPVCEFEMYQPRQYVLTPRSGYHHMPYIPCVISRLLPSTLIILLAFRRRGQSIPLLQK